MPAPMGGRVGEIGWGKQVAEGTALTDPTLQTVFAGGGLQLPLDVQAFNVTDPNTAEIVAEYKSLQRGGGQFQIVATPTAPGLLYLAAFGTEAVTGAGDPYTHTFTLANDSSLVWLTMFERVTDEYYKLTDTKIDSISWLWEAGQPVMVDVSVASKSGERLGSAYSAVTPDSLDAAILMPGPTAGQSSSLLRYDEDATPASTQHRNITRARVTLRRNLVIQQTDDLKPQYIFARAYAVDVEMDVWWEDAKLVRTTYFGSASGNTPLKTLVHGSLQLESFASNNVNHNLALQVPKVRFEVPLPEATQDGSPVTLTVRGSALKPSGSSMITCVQKNARSTGY